MYKKINLIKMGSSSKCEDILNWKNPKMTIAALIGANILYFLVRNIDISVVALLSQLLFYYIVGKIVCNKFDINLGCNSKDDKCEEELKELITNLNRKLKKIISLDDIPSLISICLICIIISSYLENFKSVTILIIFFDIYVLLQNETIKKQKEKYSTMLYDLFNKNILEKIPKYKEEKLD